MNIIRHCLPVLAAIITTCNDQDTIVDAAWALSYLSDGDNDRIQEVVNLNLVPAFENMLKSGIQQLIIPALRTLGNIVSGDEEQTQTVVDVNVFPSLVMLLSHHKKNVRKETCWMLSNIAAGSYSQLDSLVMTPLLIDNVLIQMSSTTEWDVRKEATWVICNVATGGSSKHIRSLVEKNAMKHICDLLDVGDVRILLVAMEALEAILKFGSYLQEAEKKFFYMVDDFGGIDKLEQLQEHENTEIYNKAIKLLETYFGGAEEDSENLMPATNDHGNFSFGITQNRANKLYTPELGTHDLQFEFSF